MLPEWKLSLNTMLLGFYLIINYLEITSLICIEFDIEFVADL